MISRQGGAAEQGRVLSASQSLSAAARVLGPWWAGLAFAHVGLSVPYLAAAALALVALGVLAVAVRGGEVAA
jgi:predicted MFS family arabinose efflux permease